MSNSQMLAEALNVSPPWDEEDTEVEVFQEPAWWYIVDYTSDTRVKAFGTIALEGGYYTIYNDNGEPVLFAPARGAHALRADVFNENYSPEEDGDDDQVVG